MEGRCQSSHKGDRFFFLALLSSKSVPKIGFVQTELDTALNELRNYPPDQIYIIPARLDECTPKYEMLYELNWVDLFPSYKDGLKKILRVLELYIKPVQTGEQVVLPREALIEKPAQQEEKQFSTVVDEAQAYELPKIKFEVNLSDGDFELILGSSSECDFALTELKGRISPRHAALKRTDDRLFLRDLNSSQGTFLNYKKIGSKWREITLQDNVLLGAIPIEIPPQTFTWKKAS
jgi:hypothetical protein